MIKESKQAMEYEWFDRNMKIGPAAMEYGGSIATTRDRNKRSKQEMETKEETRNRKVETVVFSQIVSGRRPLSLINQVANCARLIEWHSRRSEPEEAVTGMQSKADDRRLKPMIGD